MQRIIDQALSRTYKPDTPPYLRDAQGQLRDSQGQTPPYLRDSKGQLRDAQGQKVYVCSGCSKMFPTPAMLRRHEMIHTGERPYKCEDCGKTFQQKVHLTGHQRRVHPVDTAE